MGFAQLRQTIIPKAITNSLAGFQPTISGTVTVIFKKFLSLMGTLVGKRQLHKR